jgi:Ras-related protein Rab-1A
MSLMSSALESEYDYLFKVLIVGNSAVGKSSIVTRFSEDEYQPTYITTIGVDFKVRTFKVDDKVVKVQLWDTAGQERFRAITHNYYRGAHGVVMTYDVSDRDTFEDVGKVWLKEVQRYARPGVKMALVGNKSDLDGKFEDWGEKEEAKALCEVHGGVPHVRTSAKDRKGVDEAFEELARSMMAETDRASAEEAAKEKALPMRRRLPADDEGSCCIIC